MDNKSSFSNIISLGAWCQVSHQIKRRYGFCTYSPFDWLVTPLDSLINILDGQLKGAFEAFITDPLTKVAKCVRYGVLTPHEFNITADETTIFRASDILKANSKLTHKYNMMLKTLQNTEGKTLFVRMGGYANPAMAWPSVWDHNILRTSDVLALEACLNRNFPEITHSLLIVIDSGFLNYDIDREALPANVHLYDINWKNDGTRWEGCDAVWDDIFSTAETVLGCKPTLAHAAE